MAMLGPRQVVQADLRLAEWVEPLVQITYTPHGLVGLAVPKTGCCRSQTGDLPEGVEVVAALTEVLVRAAALVAEVAGRAEHRQAGGTAVSAAAEAAAKLPVTEASVGAVVTERQHLETVGLAAEVVDTAGLAGLVLSFLHGRRVTNHEIRTQCK